MKHRVFTNWIAAILIVLNGCAPSSPLQKPVVRVVVIGGMVMTGMWQQLANRFTADTGYPVKLVASGPKPVLIEAFQKGEADLLTMHSSDQGTDLIADGYAVGGQPWARNELVIVGPTDDPARIKGMTDGAAALRKIAEAHASFVGSAALRPYNERDAGRGNRKPSNFWASRTSAHEAGTEASC